MSTIRLAKALSQAGVASRRKSEELIFSGKIEVNGEVVTTPQTQIDWEKDILSFEKKKIKAPKNKHYILFHKPAGFHCAHDERKKNIYSFFPPHWKLFSLGRLDRDTTGLLLLTNDGDFCQKVIHPSAGLEKEYIVSLKESVTKEICQSLEKGSFIEGRRIRPKRVEKIGKHLLSITVMEGKKREIRIFIEKRKLTLLALKRVRLGPLHIGRLKAGEFRPLTLKEQEKLLTASKLGQKK